MGRGLGNSLSNSQSIHYLGGAIGSSLFWRPADFLNPFVSFEYEAAQPAGGAGGSSSTPNTFSQVSTLEAGLDLNFNRHWSLELAGQWGWEDFPSGTYYSLLLGQVATSTMAGSQNFNGFVVSLGYDFCFFTQFLQKILFCHSEELPR